MAVFLFLVDTLWTFILRLIGVLQFSGGGGLGFDGLSGREVAALAAKQLLHSRMPASAVI